MIGPASLSLQCPAMKLTRIGFGVQRTDAEPMLASFKFADGTTLQIPNVVIPPTNVHRVGLGHWSVDACIGQGGGMTVNLPKEPVVVDLLTLTVTAKAITATVQVALPDGSTGSGSVVFPDCVFDLLSSTAQSVTAEGTVTFR